MLENTKTTIDLHAKSRKSRDEDAQLRLDFQKVVRHFAHKGVLYASQSTLAAALSSKYRLITPAVVARLIREDESLLRIGDYKQGVHGVPYLVLDMPSRASTARRKAEALKMLLRLVKKRKASEDKNANDPHVNSRYGARYRHKRAFWVGRLLFEGSMPCTRCRKAVKDGQDLHLDHVDGSDTEIAGWAHPWCNRKHQLKARLASWFKPTFTLACD